ncbi:MAG: DUF2442 domain-containing protein [Saprospiraceae bacterium]|nr:DUF2442 domain-containing protein [Saprospiraceae bacterium]
MILEVVNAKYISDYKVYVRFNNHAEMILNLEPHLDGEIYQPLKDINYFKKFKIELNTISWENGADFAPEFLMQISELVEFGQIV